MLDLSGAIAVNVPVVSQYPADVFHDVGSPAAENQIRLSFADDLARIPWSLNELASCPAGGEPANTPRVVPS